MNYRKATLLLIVAGCVVAGCSADKSEATQQMPASASAPNQMPTNPNGNLPKNAQDAISKAAPPPSGG